jgi:hypothetical protein
MPWRPSGARLALAVLVTGVTVATMPTGAAASGPGPGSGTVTLTLSATSGPMGSSLAAKYQVRTTLSCNTTVDFTWNGKGPAVDLGSVRLGSTCLATWQGKLPTGASGLPGTYTITATPARGSSFGSTSAKYKVLAPDGTGGLAAAPAQGTPGASVTLTYSYSPASACPGGTAYFGWGTPAVALGSAAMNAATCSASWTGTPPVETLGTYPVQAALDPGDGSRTAAANAGYTIAAATPAPAASGSAVGTAPAAAAPADPGAPSSPAASATAVPAADPTPQPAIIVIDGGQALPASGAAGRTVAATVRTERLTALPDIRPLGGVLPGNLGGGAGIWIVLAIVNAAAIWGMVRLRRGWSEQIVD